MANGVDTLLSGILPTRGIGGLFIRLYIAELIRHQAQINNEVNEIGRVHAARAASIQKTSAPRGPTGDLRRSITVDRYRSHYDEPDIWTIGPTVDYGRFVEYGTSRQQPQPFVGPSGDAVTEPYYEAIKRVVFRFWD